MPEGAADKSEYNNGKSKYADSKLNTTTREKTIHGTISVQT